MAMNPTSEIAPPMGGGHGAQCRRSPSPRLSALLLLAMLPLRSCTFTVPTMVVGGNFTLGGRPSNLAQYDPKLKLWIDQFEPDLYVYGATSGAVSDIATNRSADGSGFDELYVVGAFDTICSTCQAQFCSVGRWTGQHFRKVGEGLCSSQSDPTTTIEALVIGNSGDLFVGGAFATRVWNGSAFVTVENVAMYEGEKQRWLPLESGVLGCSGATLALDGRLLR